MRKQEKIQEAYGEYWEQVKDYVDENGWITTWDLVSYLGVIPKDGFKVKIKGKKIKHQDNLHRPKSLKGIENNNGWIKIESEEQYDELENGEYEWYNIENGKYDKGDLWSYGVFTHYKIVPKIEPQPPIY